MDNNSLLDGNIDWQFVFKNKRSYKKCIKESFTIEGLREYNKNILTNLCANCLVLRSNSWQCPPPAVPSHTWRDWSGLSRVSRAIITGPVATQSPGIVISWCVRVIFPVDELLEAWFMASDSRNTFNWLVPLGSDRLRQTNPQVELR